MQRDRIGLKEKNVTEPVEQDWQVRERRGFIQAQSVEPVLLTQRTIELLSVGESRKELVAQLCNFPEDSRRRFGVIARDVFGIDERPAIVDESVCR